MNPPIDDAEIDFVKDLIRLELMGALEVEHGDDGEPRFRPTTEALAALEATDESHA